MRGIKKRNIGVAVECFIRKGGKYLMLHRHPTKKIGESIVMKIKKITVQGNRVSIISHTENEEFISLTDMLKAKDGDFFISDWLRNRNTVEFLGIWEKLHNPNFNYGEFATIKSKAGLNSYKIHTDAVKGHLIPENISKKRTNIMYANEADVLNIALFGKTAKEWRDENPRKEGNIRDYADVTQLVVLANMEGINAELIRQGMSQPGRLVQLNQIAIIQMRSLLGSSSVQKLMN